MDRLENVRKVVDSILKNKNDLDEIRDGFIHLYGVATIATLIALRRNLDPELSTIAAMLHDISSYKTGDSTNHAHLSALEAEKILTTIGSFTKDEIKSVCDAISSHSAKDKVDGPMADLLKDADVLQHYLYNPMISIKLHEELSDRAHAEARLARLKKVRDDLGLLNQLDD